MVSKSTSRAKCAGLTWAAVVALSEEELERRRYGDDPAEGPGEG
ncbi:MAG: hypothetical protein AAF715_23990 [Myxococcota bacterium]